MKGARIAVIATSFAALAGVTAQAAPAHPKPRPDLADVVQGVYDGSVISDSRGASRSDVQLTVTKVSPNLVQVTSDYSRLPTFQVRLTRVMQTIQNAGGSAVFLLDVSKSPPKLDVTVDGASWSWAQSR